MSYFPQKSLLIRTGTAVALLAVTFVALQNAPTKQAQADGGQPSITVVSPNGGEVFQTGSTMNITWAQENVDTVYIMLKYCSSCGVWIATSVPVNINSTEGSYQWTIPSWIPSRSTYTMSITGYHTGIGSQTDESNGQFTINQQPALTAAIASSSPFPRTYVQGQTNAEFARINFSAVASDVTLSSVTLQAAPTASGVGVANLSVYVGNTLLGTVDQLDEKTGTAVVNFSTPLVIPQYATVILSLKADITYDAFDHLALGITGATATANGQPAPVLNLPVYGAPMYFSEK